MRNRSTRRLAFWTLVLFVLWLLLSETFTPAHMVVGLVSALVVAMLNKARSSPRSFTVRWVKALLYFPWLFVRIFLSGLHLSYLILHPRLPIRPRLFPHRVRLGNEQAVMLMGNSITLTPGTVTVEAGEGELLVHAMDDKSTEDVATGRLERKVTAIFGPGGDRS